MLSTTSCLRAVASPGWTVSDRIPVGGDGNWDYATLQAEQHRLYVTHQDRMVVIDLSSRAEIRSIPGQEIHGVALVPELNRGFVSDGDAGNVILFDLKTLEVSGTIKAQPDADAICYDPVRRRVFACCGDGTLTVVRQDSADSYTIDEVVQTELGVRTMAFDSATNTIYAPSAKLSPISPQDPHPHPHPIPGTFHILVLTETTKK